MSLSANGQTVAIGASSNDGNGFDSGHVRIYSWTGTSWSQLGTDINGGASRDYSGHSVSLAADGRTVAIGSPYNNDNGTYTGQVRIYSWIGSSWSQLGDDINGESIDDKSGQSVSLSDDGVTVAIGAHFNSGSTRHAGHVRVYSWDGLAWNQLGTDIDGEASYDYSGHSVSLSSDGEVVAIGAPDNGGTSNHQPGSVHIYSWTGSTWSQIGADIDGEAIYDFLGTAVSLAANGQTVAIGAEQNDGNGNNSGHARIYSWAGSTWTQVGADIDGESAEDLSGRSVSLSGDGQTVAIGAPKNNGNGNDSGHVRVFRLRSNSTALSTETDTISVTVEQTNNPPSNVALTVAVNTILETADTSSAIRIAGIDVTDDELGSNVVNLSGPDASSFYYTAGFGGAFGGGFAQGGIYLNPGIELDAISKPSFQFTVEVSDTSLPGSDPVTVDHTLTVLNVNNLPTGSVTIAGMPREDEVLTASNSLADEDGLGAISYQWKRDTVAINGATNSTYTLVQVDVDTVITVTASYTDQSGTNESVSSTATAEVLNVNDLPTIEINGAFGRQFSGGSGTAPTGYPLEAIGEGNWLYSSGPSSTASTTFYPTNLGQLSGCTDHGYVSYFTEPGDSTVGRFTPPDNSTGQYHLYETHVVSDFDQTVSYWLRGNDGVSLFVDDEFVIGGGFGVENTGDIVFQAGVPRKILLAGHNAFEKTNVTFRANGGRLEDAPGLRTSAVAWLVEDTTEQTVSLTGITAGDGEVQVLSVTVASDNPGLIPDPTVTYTSPDTTGSIAFTPVADQSGTATLTITVTDGGLDNDLATTEDNGTTTRTIVVNVAPINDLPTIEINGAFGRQFSGGSGTAPTGYPLEAIGEGNWLYSSGPSSTASTTFYPTNLGQLSGCTDHGYVSYFTEPGDSTVGRFTPPDNSTGQYHLYETHVVSDFDQTVSYWLRGNDGVSLFVDDEFVIGGGFGVENTGDIVFQAGVPRKILLAGHNAFEKTNVTFRANGGRLEDAPGLRTSAVAWLVEDTTEQTVSLTGITAGDGEVQVLSVTVASDNPGLIPDPTVTYTSPDTTGSIAFTPVADQSGTADAYHNSYRRRS